MCLGPQGPAFLPLQGAQWPDILRRSDSGHPGVSLAPIVSAQGSAKQRRHITAQGGTVKGEWEAPGRPPGGGVRVWEEEELIGEAQRDADR